MPAPVAIRSSSASRRRQVGLHHRDAVVRRRRTATGDRHAVARRLGDRLRRLDPVEVGAGDVRLRGRRRTAGRRRVAVDGRVAPDPGIGLDAVERGPGQPRALVDVAQRARASRRGVVVVVRRDVQADVLRVDRRRQVRHRDLDLEVVAAAGVGVVRRRLVVADPRGARGDLHAGRVRRVGDGVGQRTRRVALVVVGVARPAGPVRRRCRSSSPGSLVYGKTPSLNVDAVSMFVCVALPRGSIRSSTESACQCPTHSAGVTA